MRSYQKIQQPYKPEIQDIWTSDIIVEEKVDGSQFRIEIDDKGNITCGSHHVELGMTDSTFHLATEQAQKLFTNWKAEEGDLTSIFCEYLKKPKQNAIPYERVPKHNLVVFDIMNNGKWFTRDDKEEFCLNWDLEVVPILWKGNGKDFTKELQEQLLKTPSFLGHQAGYDRIEGIVVKAYDRYYDVNNFPYLEGHWLCTKIVNDSFKEKNKIENPSAGNAIQALKESCRTEARWRKAIQHLDEKGELIHDMKDMGLLCREVVKDLEEEEKEVIKDQLWKLYGKEITSFSVKGLPEFYKNMLVANNEERSEQ